MRVGTFVLIIVLGKNIPLHFHAEPSTQAAVFSD